jgi:hypothetical protein
MQIMAVLRIHKKQNGFVILDKTCLNDEKLSWGAKGLHAYLISLPDDWQVRVSDLQRRALNGRDAVRTFLNELESTGYIKKATRRNDDTGQFGGVEYLVLETPESNFKNDLPEPEKPSPVKKETDSPETGNPSAGFPATGKPPLLNNNRININKLNNKTAADNQAQLDETLQKETKAAAVIFSQQKAVQNPKQGFQQKTKINVLSLEDAMIGESLTLGQIKRVQSIVETFDSQNKEQLTEEICFCLLNKSQFTGCGRDFSKKLNAIRAVILRGDWQTPVGMLAKDDQDNQPEITLLRCRLIEAKAEEIHFNRLLNFAKEEAKVQLAGFVEKAQKKIQHIEALINQSAATGKVQSISG